MAVGWFGVMGSERCFAPCDGMVSFFPAVDPVVGLDGVGENDSVETAGDRLLEKDGRSAGLRLDRPGTFTGVLVTLPDICGLG